MAPNSSAIQLERRSAENSLFVSSCMPLRLIHYHKNRRSNRIMKTKKFALLLNLVMLAALILAACGGSPAVTEAPPEVEAPAATDAPVATEPPAGQPEPVRRWRHLQGPALHGHAPRRAVDHRHGLRAAGRDLRPGDLAVPTAAAAPLKRLPRRRSR